MNHGLLNIFFLQFFEAMQRLSVTIQRGNASELCFHLLAGANVFKFSNEMEKYLNLI